VLGELFAKLRVDHADGLPRLAVLSPDEDVLELPGGLVDRDLLDVTRANVGGEVAERHRLRTVLRRHQLVDGDEHEDQEDPQKERLVALLHENLTDPVSRRAPTQRGPCRVPTPSPDPGPRVTGRLRGSRGRRRGGSKGEARKAAAE
jgi:hypothetical protein